MTINPKTRLDVLHDQQKRLGGDGSGLVAQFYEGRIQEAKEWAPVVAEVERLREVLAALVGAVEGVDEYGGCTGCHAFTALGGPHAPDCPITRARAMLGGEK